MKPRNTISVVEMSDSGIHWAEPRDLKADEMSYRINDPDQPCIRSRHNGGANVAFCDGSVTLRRRLSFPGTHQSPDDHRRRRRRAGVLGELLTAEQDPS